MSQTNQEEGAAPTEPRVRKEWEWFWRIIAGLMVIIIGWIFWVLYQITPRPVVTPLAYASQGKLRAAQQPATGAASAVASLPPAAAPPVAQEGAAALAAVQPAPEAVAAALAMDQAQAGARTGAHQSSADVQAAALEKREERLKREEHFKREGLKLSTEITTPLLEKKSNRKK
ncbi:MAG TPA: hypothetical protein VIJ43_10455 [Burkholderiales bacterium]